MKTLIKTTHIEKVRQKNLTKDEQICKILGVSHLAYCWHQYECYEKVIALVTQGLPLAAMELRHSSVFRGFFNSEWCFRNENDFLPYANDLLDEYLDLDEGVVYPAITCGDEQLLEEYRFIHSPNRLYHDDDFREKYAVIVDFILSIKK